MTSLFLLAQDVPPTAPGGPSPMLMIGAMLCIFIAIQLFTSGNQRKKQKEMLDKLKTGDKILTIGGICGVISTVKPDRVIIKTAGDTYIEVLKTSVQGPEAPKAEDAKPAAKK